MIPSATRAVSSSGLLHCAADPLERGEAGLAEAAPRNGDGAEKRLVIGRVGEQPQVGQEVLHLAPLVEADRADEAIRDARPTERLFQRPRLRIGPIEHRHVGIAPVARGAPALELAGYPLRLVALVGRGEERHRLAAAPPRGERLPDAAAVLRDDAVGRVEHDLGGAVVLLEPDQPRPGEILQEVLHVAHVGAAPAVDRLVVVAHDADVPVRAEQSDQLVLGSIGVLELVHQNEAELGLVRAEPVGMLPKQRERMEQQIVEVHRVRGLERRPQGRVHVGRHLRQAVERRGARRELGRRHHPVLGRRDDRLHRARGKQLGRMAPLFHQPLDQAQSVVFVVDRELAPEAEQLGLATEQTGRQRVKRADPEPGRIAGEQSADPVLHLARGLVGEGHREDAIGRDAVPVDQVGDAGGEHARLARPRAGQDQDRSVHVVHGLLLGRIERALELGRRGIDHAADCASGIRITKLAPLSVGSSVRVPRCASSTTRRASARPMPQPPPWC